MVKTPLASALTFGGGTALAVAYLHHRLSEDLDFFSLREVEQHEILPLVEALKQSRLSVDQQIEGPRRILVLSNAKGQVGHIDVSYYPFDPIDRPTPWQGLRIDSLLDMTVNKVQAVLTRFRPRDFVDLYFLLREGRERDLSRLLGFVRAKFGDGCGSHGACGTIPPRRGDP
ncbi:MAG TPA: nucleotidyl transferase AbiEii/AbiGii toxin family protein [Polyangiaceae bacterium]|nr:nucleotidyl transferase AbiEii/AbiGii toxin family protein [Polyangiaceae bacterium]